MGPLGVGEGPETASWDVRLRPISGDVLSEIFDGEAVVVQLRTGSYYAFDVISTSAWERFTAQEALSEVAARLSGGAQDAGEVGRQIIALAHMLCDEELAEADGPLPPRPEGEGATPWPSGVTKFTDMADLLVLDPIHDIDLDGDGWPVVGGEPGPHGQSVAP